MQTDADASPDGDSRPSQTGPFAAIEPDRGTSPPSSLLMASDPQTPVPGIDAGAGLPTAASRSVDLALPIQLSVVSESSVATADSSSTDAPSGHVNHITSVVVCPFDDRVHYSSGDDNLTGMTCEQLAESDKVFSQDFAELSFISRVLSMSLDLGVPLLERFKFLCIVSQNLDELFSKRPANIVIRHPTDLDLFPRATRHRLPPLSRREGAFKIAVQTIVDRQYACLQDDLFPELQSHGIEIVKYSDVPTHQQFALDSYFDEHLGPLLTPFVGDQTHPFPMLQSHDLHILAILIKASDELERRVLIRVPTEKRLVPIDGSKCRFVSTEDLCIANLHKICRGMILRKAYPFRITRRIKPTIDDETFGDEANYVDHVVEECHRRRSAPTTRLEVLEDTPADVINLLTPYLRLDESHIYKVRGNLLDLKSCMDLASVPVPELRETIQAPVEPPAFKGLFERLQTKPGAIFDVLAEKDVLVEYPEHSFKHSAVLFLEAAARDPRVRRVETALYRAGSMSPVVKALILAAKNGKEVTVVVELKASFNELQNVQYARDLQRAGCNVVCGIVGLKVHSKATLVVREEADGGLVSFCNISSGNYNRDTAELYTDVSLYTKREDIARELHAVFNSLTGCSDHSDYKTLLVAPRSMSKRFVELIRIEVRNARAGRPARISCQLNGLSDKQITKELYFASQAGVKIDLIVRGQCRLRPGIPGKSDNIRVFSWLGPCLQHRRIFFFQNGGKGRFFVGSADWRTRNLHDRVEVVVPVEDRAICKRLSKAFDIINDGKNVWKMSWDGRYCKGMSNPRELPVWLAVAPRPTRIKNARINNAKDETANGPNVTAQYPAGLSTGFSRRTSPRRWTKALRRIEGNAIGGQVDVKKTCAGSVSVRLKDGQRTKLDEVEFFAVGGGNYGNPWLIPTGFVNDGESD